MIKSIFKIYKAKVFFILVVIVITSCKNESIDTNVSIDDIDAYNLKEIDTIETFIDSLNFGEKKQNKVEIYKIKNGLKVSAKIYLSEKISNDWLINDSLIINCDEIHRLKVEIMDFNNDSYNDLLFTSGTAARLVNNVQTLVLFSEGSKLKWIKNSENFPSLMYNKKLDCIDALTFTGCLTTKFLRIKNDSLIDFASVECCGDSLFVDVKDKNGKWNSIKRAKVTSTEIKRFINYNPIEIRN